MTTRVLAALALAAASKANVQTFEDVCVPTTEEIYRDPVFVLNRYGSLDVHLHVPLFIFGASG